MATLFQCPLSGLVGCNSPQQRQQWMCPEFQCPLSGLVGCNLSCGRGHRETRQFQCPLSGLVGCNRQNTDGKPVEELGFNAL